MTKKEVDTDQMATRIVSVRSKDSSTQIKDHKGKIRKNRKSRDTNGMRKQDRPTDEKGKRESYN